MSRQERSTERIAAAATAGLGAMFLLSGVGVVMGYWMSESTSLGLLAGTVAALVTVGSALLLLARALMRSPR